MPKSNPINTNPIVDFETSLQQLEDIVSKMEQGQLSLEQSLAAFEQGVKLTRTCQETLKKADQRVSKLIQHADSFELANMDSENPA